jgi:hypothetical protein
MMKSLRVFSLRNADHEQTLATVAGRMSQVEKQFLSYAPWAAYPYKPGVLFSIAYDKASLYLQYTVKEAVVQAAFGRTNEPVYQDSCVEFFISFDEGATYYNFEFNCIGTVLAGYGRGRTDRQWLSGDVLDTINTQSTVLRKGKDRMPQWELTVVLPLKVFTFQNIDSLQGQQARANFYKCGDHLPVPHFLAWSNIESDSPDFHLPQFFGTLLFD